MTIDRSGTLSLLTTALAAVVMAVGLSLWWQASHDNKLQLATTRDRVLVVANQRIETLNTLDYRDIDGGLKSWLAATTGPLHEQLSEVDAEDRKLLEGQQKITTARVVELALTEVDPTAGRATALASLEITVKGKAEEPAVKRNRFAAELVKVKGEWLLESLQQVSVNLG